MGGCVCEGMARAKGGGNSMDGWGMELVKSNCHGPHSITSTRLDMGVVGSWRDRLQLQISPE